MSHIKSFTRSIALLLIATALLLSSCSKKENVPFAGELGLGGADVSTDSLKIYEEYNGGVPRFSIPSPIASYERYSPLDELGRCGVAEACLGQDLMPPPDEERESLSSVTPSGWNQKKYEDIVEDDYLYNRCHLIGFQLAGEQKTKENLITGTRYMNVKGMLPFENKVADYIDKTGNHVMYRATPVYAERYDLVASGVILEALSVEDGGAGICFAVYIYNRQPGIVINYRDGSSYLATPSLKPSEETNVNADELIINKSSKKFHLPSCSGVKTMSDKNKETRKNTQEVIDALLEEGFLPCVTCKPTG